MTELLRALEAVVGLSDAAKHAALTLSAEEWESARDALNDSAVNFLRTHHAEIAEAVADARRYRWLRDEAHKEPHTRSVGIYCEWGLSCDLSSIGGTDADVEIDAAIDAHNSAREVGE